MPDADRQWIALRSADLSVEVDPLGAQLSVLRDPDGRNLLWNGDPAFWTGRAPILFPIVGTLVDGSYRVNSMVYRLPRHGFARTRLFTVLESSPAAATFCLRADADTLAMYPFHFELEIQFALQDATLSVTTWVRNLGDTPMPASIGYHPAFRWPLTPRQAREAYVIEFETDEPATVRRLDSHGLLSPKRYATPIVDRRLELNDALFTDDVLIFDRPDSRRIIYGAAAGPKLRVHFQDATFLGLWTKPGAPFICIEPWQGVADVSGFAGELSEKIGVFVLAPGESRRHAMDITLLAQPASA